MLEKVIKLIHVRTHCQLADLLTKALSFNQFSSSVCRMGMINIHSVASLEGEYQNVNKNHEEHEDLTESVTRKAATLKEKTKQQKTTVASSSKLRVA